MDKETCLLWIVDHSPDDRAEMKRALLNGSKRRYRFREIETGSECLRAVQESAAERPTCVLLDDHLPDFDASELLPALGGFEAIPFPVVVIGGSECSSPAVVLQNGAQEFIGKEWLTPGSLTRAVESAIERHALVTQRKALEEALQISERRYRALFESTGDVITMLGPNGFLAGNQAALRLTGCATEQEFLSKGPADFSPPTQPDGQSSEALAAQHMAMAFRNGSHRFEWRHRRADGSALDGDVLLTRIDLPEGPILQSIARDITARKRAEAEAARLQDLLQDGESIAQLGSWEYDVASQDLIWSSGLRRIYGIAPDPSPDYPATLCQFVHPDDVDRVDRTFRDAVVQQSAFVLEHRIVRPDGTVRAVRNLAHPRFDEEGTLIKYVGVTLDETERKQAEEALERSETRLRLATEGAQVGTWSWNLGTGIVEWDPLCAEHMGLPEGVSPSYDYYVSILHPDDRERVERLVSDALENRTVFDAEYRVVHSDGSFRWIIGRGQGHYREDGETIGMMGVTLDITESKRVSEQLVASEERFRLAMDVTKDGIWDWNLKTGETYYSPGYFRMLGYEPGELPETVDTWIGLLHPEERQSVVAEARRRLAASGEYQIDYRVCSRSGDYIWVTSRGQVVERDVDGNPFRAIGTHIDITGLKRTEQELQVSERRFRALFESAGEAMGLLGPHGFSECNPATLRLYGCTTQQEFLSKGPMDFSPPTQPDGQSSEALAAQHIEAAFRTGSHRFEWRHFRADGTPFDAELLLTRIDLPEGPVLQAIARDITESKRAEAEAARLRHLLEDGESIAQFGSWEYIVATEDTVWSPGLCRIYGVAPDFSPNDPAILPPFAHPDDVERVDRTFRAALVQQRTFEVETRIVRPDGTERWIRTVAHPRFDEAGALVKYVGATVDESERKQAEENMQRSEERLRLATEGARIGTWSWDLDTGAVDWDPLCAQHMALREGASPSYESFVSVIHPDDRDRVERLVQESLQTRTPYSAEYRVMNPDGGGRWIVGRGEGRYGSDGRPVGMSGITLDVTDAKRIQEQLAASEVALREAEAWRLASHYTRSLIETSLDPLVTIGADGVVTDVNRATEDVTGLPRENLIGSDFSSYFTEPERARAGYQTVFAAGQVRDYPLIIRHTSGRLTNVLYNASTYRNEAGEVLGVFAAARDVTDRIETERRLQESELTLQRAQVVARIGSWRLHADSELFEITAETARLFDLPVYRPVTFAEWFARVHPNDQSAVEAAWRSALRGTPYNMTYRIVARGETVWIRALAELEFDEGGTFVGGVGTVQDITLLKQAEQQVQRTVERLRLATDAADIGIWEWNFAEDRLHWDHRVCDWYEVPDSVGQSGIDYAFWRSRVHPEDLERTECSFMGARLSDSSWTDEFRIVLPGGRIRYIESAAIIERQPDGTAIGIIGVNRDVTVQRALEEALRQAKEAADAANVAKGQFLANMSHELRTPMNAILGMTQLLQQEVLSPDHRKMLQRIGTAGHGLLGLLNDILDFSKLNAGELQLEQRPFDLDAVTVSILSLMVPLASEKDLVFEVQGSDEPIGPLLGDTRRLQQVLVNLVGNAIKFTERGFVRLHVLRLDRDEGGVRLCFEVQDTGIGMTPEQVAEIGRPFVQADTSISRRFGGTGLGLAISRQLLEEMGGTLTVESTPGFGSTFGFELTFQRAPEGVAVRPATPKMATVTGPRLPGCRILLVEDSEMNRDVVERALRREQAEVVSVNDGRQAVELLRTSPTAFDAVLMDIQMPVMDGLTATRLIRGELGLKDRPVIAFSAGVLTNEQRDALSAGLNDFIAKPVDLEDMVAVLLRWIPEVERVGEVTAKPASPSEDSGSFPVIDRLDTARAALLLGRDRGFFLSLLARFAASYGSAAEETRRDLQAERREDAARRVHTLRGNAGNIGALDLAEIATRVEAALGTKGTEITGLLAHFETELHAVLAAIAPWVPEEPEEASGAETASPPDLSQLEALRQALRGREWAAHELFAKLRPGLAGLCGKEGVRSLANAIDSLRFETALKELEATLAASSGAKSDEQ